MDEWWNDTRLSRMLSKALDAAGWQGLTAWPGGVRAATVEDGKIDTPTMCRLNISRIRRDKEGLNIWLFGPAGAHELFIREGLPPVFLTLTGGLAKAEDVVPQMDELGRQLRKGLLGQQ